jgi:ring-1,2-phenylacetyl-CoA epoxidase subunit PaaD
MVNASNQPGTDSLYTLLKSVTDPEIPVLTLEDLGVLRDIDIVDDEVRVTITPTYAGCPAMEAMRKDIETTLHRAGYQRVSVRQSLSPAWSTDWMSTEGRQKLLEYGIAPPAARAADQQPIPVNCPQCGSEDTKKISEFGSTACKALYQCQSCREPFDYFKCL